MGDRAYRSLRQELSEHKEEIVMILNAWKEFEQNCKSETKAQRDHRVNEVLKKIPLEVDRQHLFYENGGKKVSIEKHRDYLFPDEKDSLGLKLLEISHKWKKDQISKMN